MRAWESAVIQPERPQPRRQTEAASGASRKQSARAWFPSGNDLDVQTSIPRGPPSGAVSGVGPAGICAPSDASAAFVGAADRVHLSSRVTVDRGRIDPLTQLLRLRQRKRQARRYGASAFAPMLRASACARRFGCGRGNDGATHHAVLRVHRPNAHDEYVCRPIGRRWTRL